ncbi:MAG: cupin domain-containing protein [Chloroflexi bacterium]|nr:cupin domain-containing protein [Chloroflexota bacterium]
MLFIKGTRRHLFVLGLFVTLLVLGLWALSHEKPKVGSAAEAWPPVKVDLSIQQDGNIYTAVVWVKNEGALATGVLNVRASVPKGAKYVDSWAGSGRGFNAGVFDGNDVGWVNPGVNAGGRQGPFVYIFDTSALAPNSRLSLSAWVSWAGGVPGTALSRVVTSRTPLPVEALRRGGYVILVRHTETDRSLIPAAIRPPEPQPMDLANCEMQAKLTEKGRDEARAIGAGFRTLGIPVGRVLTSGYCRTIETAQFGFGRYELSDILLHAAYQPIPGAPAVVPFTQRTEQLRQLLATAPAAGTNTVLITHGENIRPAVGFEIGTGEAAIFRPDGQGGFVLVARVLPTEWVAVVEKLAVGVGTPPAAGWKWAVAEIAAGTDDVVEGLNAHDYSWTFFTVRGSMELSTADGKRVLSSGEGVFVPARQQHAHRYLPQSRGLAFHLRAADDPPGALHRGRTLLVSDAPLGVKAGLNYTLRVREFTLSPGEQTPESLTADPNFVYVEEGTLTLRVGDSASSTEAGKVSTIPLNVRHIESNEGTTLLRFLVVDVRP